MELDIEKLKQDTEVTLKRNKAKTSHFLIYWKPRRSFQANTGECSVDIQVNLVNIRRFS